MTFGRLKSVGLVFMFFLVLLVGCHKKVATAPPAPPPPAPAPPPPAPTITISANPATIQRGSATTLQWEAKNAASVSITPDVGTVSVTGNRSVSPMSSVSYTATATGPGGTASNAARVTVNAPPPPPPDDNPPIRTPVTNTPLFNEAVKDVYFDYDKADIKTEFVSVLQSNATWLKNNPNVRFTIEGHCDERGSEEYNLGLGDRRANAVKEFLIGQGIPANRIMTVSYGEERPICREQSENCFSMNRRAHFAETK